MERKIRQNLKYNRYGGYYNLERGRICDRCDGKGRLPENKHVENGICFKCRGKRYLKSYYK